MRSYANSIAIPVITSAEHFNSCLNGKLCAFNTVKPQALYLNVSRRVARSHSKCTNKLLSSESFVGESFASEATG